MSDQIVSTGSPVDYASISKYVKIAMGERSVRQFAEICGTSRSSISKLVLGDFKRPVKLQLLKSIYDHAAPNTDIDWNKLLAANGMEVLNPPRSLASLTQSTSINPRDSEHKVEQILSGLFLGAEKPVLLAYDSPIPYSRLNDAKLKFDLSYLISNSTDNSSITWNFEIKVSTTQSPHTLRDLNRLLQSWLILDAYESTVLEGMQYTLVLTDPDSFSILKNRYSSVEVRNYISLCLIDLVNGQIIDEFQLTRTDGSKENLLLVFREEQQNNQLEREQNKTDDQ